MRLKCEANPARCVGLAFLRFGLASFFHCVERCGNANRRLEPTMPAHGEVQKTNLSEGARGSTLGEICDGCGVRRTC